MGMDQIKHVVILMQENRSFDEYFGTFPGAAGFQDPAGAFTDQYGNGILPFRMSTFTSSGLQRDGNGHDWDTFQSLYGGATSGTPNNWGRQGVQSVIGYYAANDVPFHWDLARTFALCDRYYGSALSATAPNRLFLMSGCVEDPQLLTNPSYIPGPGLWPGPAISEATDDPPQLGSAAAAYAAANKESLYSSQTGLGTLSWQTYADMLFRQDVQWKVYDETSILQPSPIVSPSPVNGWGSLNILQQFQSWSEYQVSQPPPGQFEADANGGTLPTISWIIPPFWASEWENDHPSDGAAYIAGKLAAILNGIDANGNPLWNSTVFILIYDESGGHFDHVVPPVAPAGPGEFLPGLPNEPFGGGFRAPAIVVSPWTFNQPVQHEPFDHTSILQFLELVTQNFVPPGGVVCTNIGSWRRETFGDLTSVFNFDNPVSAAEVMSVFPWTQPYTYPPTSPPTPTLAQTYATLAYSRFLPNKTSTLRPPTCQTWPPVVQSCEIVMPVGSYDLAEVTAAANGGSTATFSRALSVVVYGFEPNELVNANALGMLSTGIPSPTGPCTTRVPAIAFSNGFITAVPSEIAIDQDPSQVTTTTTGCPIDPGVPYTFTFTYDLVFSNFDRIFPPTPSGQGTPGTTNVYTVNASFQVDATFTATAELELVSTDDPQFYKNFFQETAYLSGELVVFSLPGGGSMFNATLGDPQHPPLATGTDALTFIQAVIANLNLGIGESDFDALNTDEAANALPLAIATSRSDAGFQLCARPRAHEF